MADILTRLFQPGVAVLALGAVLGYGAGKWASLLPVAEEKRPTAERVFRFTGLGIAMLGAVLVFMS